MSKKITHTKLNLSFTESLLKWGRVNGRKNLPWSPEKGSQYHPYKVWLSEIILQQTQLKTGKNFYKKIISTFPSVEELAKAKLEKVLSAWSGLGYYNRAKNLHLSAVKICSENKVVFPKDAKEWMQLPGVGFSTAASISAFVNKEKVPVMDANVIRVFARQFKLKEFVNSVALKKKILPIAYKCLPIMPIDMPVYTQSIMDLGSIICRPHHPKCDLCPVSAMCLAYLSKQESNYPVRKTKKIREVKKINWLVPYTKESVALVCLEDTKLWQGLWTPIQFCNSSPIPNEAFFITKFRSPISNFTLEVSIWGFLCNEQKLYKFAKWFKWKELLNSPVPSTVTKALRSFRLYL